MDNTDVSELEDGEIGDYTPLERPVTYTGAKVSLDLVNSDDGADSLSDSESDDSDSPCFKIKRQKFQNDCSASFGNNNVQNVRRSKYNIWCSEIQESALTDNLINIDVTNKNLDRSRDVESYDYSLAYSQREMNCPDGEREHEWELHPTVHSNKRRFEERGSVKQRLGRRDSSLEAHRTRQNHPRLLPDLTTSNDAELEELAADIAEKLQEQKEELILRVVEVLGKQKAIEIFEETKRIEEDGGLLIMNGRRRRTPGGVYLFLIKKDDCIPQEKKQSIFVDDTRINRDEQRNIRRKRKTDNFKKNFSEVDLPKLLTRAELVVSEGLEEGEVEDTTNPPPPPSPATDGRSDGEDVVERSPFTITDDCGRDTITYGDEDFLDVTCNSMDIF